MRPRNILKTTLYAALAAAPFVATPPQPASAQKIVAASCPQGYVLDRNSCVRTGPTPSCPTGYALSGGQCVGNTRAVSTKTKKASSNQWAFITRKAFGITSATELDGANFCAVTGSASADDANDFFKKNNLSATHVEVKDDRAGIETYQKYDCDVLVVANRVAGSTADSLEPTGDHLVLPEKFGTAPAPKPAAAPAPLPPKAPATVKTPAKPKPPATVKKQPKPKPKPQKVVRKKRCSAVRYGYSRGNTCGCAGGRVFNGHSCVRPRWW